MGDTPIAGWFLVFEGKSIYKWMIWGYTYFRNPPYRYIVRVMSSFPVDADEDSLLCPSLIDHLRSPRA